MRNLESIGLASVALMAFAAAGVVSAACSSTGNNGSTASGFGGATTSSTTQSGKTGTASGGNSGSGSMTSGLGGQFTNASGPTAATSVGGGCAGEVTQAQQNPLDMFIMLDQSGSMSDPVAGGQTQWQAVTAALKAFFNSPTTTGISVGIQYFGLPDSPACNELCSTDNDCSGCDFSGQGSCGEFGVPGMCPWSTDSCVAADYAKAEVPIQPIAMNLAALDASLDRHGPITGTPTSAALQGAVTYAADWATAHPSHLTIVVFATDGDPGECDTDLNDIDQIAAAGLAGTPSVKTFVIGVGPDAANLDGIAAAGGTNMSFLIDTNANAQQQFIDAMAAIRTSSLTCSYQIPLPEAGTPDYTLVNVQYTPGGSDAGAAITIPKVADKAACPATGDAWYYDDNNAPSQIIMCDSTCSELMMDSSGSVEVVLGCKTVVQ